MECWYNDKFGIRCRVGDLGELVFLVSSRAEACRAGKKLDPFLILGGRFWLSVDGRCLRASFIMRDGREDFPLVLPIVDREVFSRIVFLDRAIPHERARCALCGKGWTIEDCHEAMLNRGRWFHPKCFYS